MTTGADKNNISPGPTDQPYNSHRFNAMRWDSSSGQYDMGFRNYDPGLNQFVSRDMYDGALANMNLTADPFTGSPYAFGQGNPISNIELDGHMPALLGVVIVHDFASPGYEQRSEMRDFYAWFRQAIEDFIEFE